MYLPAFHYLNVSTGQLKCDGTGAETKFRLSAKRTSPFKSAGASVQSTTGSASAVVMLDTTCSEIVWRVLATHSIRQFPLHFLCRASPCVITFHLSLTRITLENHPHTIRHSRSRYALWCLSGNILRSSSMFFYFPFTNVTRVGEDAEVVKTGKNTSQYILVQSII